MNPITNIGGTRVPHYPDTLLSMSTPDPALRQAADDELRRCVRGQRGARENRELYGNGSYKSHGSYASATLRCAETNSLTNPFAG